MKLIDLITILEKLIETGDEKIISVIQDLYDIIHYIS